MSMLEIGPSAGSLMPVTPDPASMTWGLQDVSASDAGRTQDGRMHKMQVAQKRKLQVTWNFPDAAQASGILRAVNSEYFFVRYFDPMAGERQTREFYVGDRTAPFKWFELPARGTRLATLSFDLIER